MKQYVTPFRKFLAEAAKHEYDENLYEVLISLVVSKAQGGDKTQTFAEIRAVNDITIVKQVPNTSSEDEQNFYADVVLRFIPQAGVSGEVMFRRLTGEIESIPAVVSLEAKTRPEKIS